jgi:hypothetical protein
MKYLSLLDDLFTSLLTDIASLRYQLVLAAFGFNVYLFENKAEASVQLASIGLLTCVYGLYFSSKKHQAEMEAVQKGETDDIKNTDRNPDI